MFINVKNKHIKECTRWNVPGRLPDPGALPTRQCPACPALSAVVSGNSMCCLQHNQAGRRRAGLDLHMRGIGKHSLCQDCHKPERTYREGAKWTFIITSTWSVVSSSWVIKYQHI